MGKTKIKRKEPAIILLDILLKGYPVIKNNDKYWLSKDNYLCMEATKENTTTGKKEKVGLKIGFGGYGLNHFIDWANSFTIEELAINGANVVLNDLKRGE